MVSPLEGVLHARYMTPILERGTNNYGGQDFGSPCDTIPLPGGRPYNKFEAPTTSNTADVSRGTFRYFSNSIYLRGAPSGLGGMDGAIEADSVRKQAINRAVSFLNKTYALIGNKIYVYDESEPDLDARWKTSLTLTGKDGTKTNSIGLYPVFANGKSLLVTAWNDGAGSNWRSAQLDEDGNWTVSGTSSVVSPNDTNGGVTTECQFAGRIYFVAARSVAGFSSFYWYDYINNTFGSQTFNTAVRNPFDFCPFMGELFCISKDSSRNIRLHRLTTAGGPIAPVEVAAYQRSAGGVWGDFNEALTSADDYEGRPLMFVDNVYDSVLNGLSPVLYTSYVTHSAVAAGFDANDSNHGLHHAPYRSDGNGGLVSQESASQALGMRANPFKANQNQETFFTGFGRSFYASRKDEGMVLRTFVDQKTRDANLSGRTAIVVSSRWSGQGCGHPPGGGGDYTNQFYHKFAGSGNVDGGTLPDPPVAGGQAHSLEFIGFPSKNTRHRAAVHERIGGGSRYHTLDGNGDRIADIVFKGVGTTEQEGVIRINYTIIPSVATPTGSFVDVRWFFDTNYHAPETPCTLVDASDTVSAISGSYTAINIEVQPSGHIYYVDWQAKGDGVTGGNRLLINGMLILASPDFSNITSPSGLDGLVAWYDANDALTVASGANDKVTDWLDIVTGSGLTQASASFQPTLVASGNGSLSGIRFDSANSEYLFSSGNSPFGSNDPSTIFIVYEPVSLTSTDTMFSLSEDVSSSGTTSREYMNASVVAGGTSDVLLEAQDLAREAIGSGSRPLVLASGGETSKTRLIAWTEIAFESEGMVFPSGDTDLTDIISEPAVEQTGLLNMTFGRFSGAQVSGVYSNAGQYYDGLLYEIAIYDRKLTPEEVEAFRVYVANKYTLDV